MKRLCLISCVLILCGCAGRVRHSYEVETALKSLDQVISNKEMIEGQKENRILRLREGISSAVSDLERYGIYNDLFNEYFQYNIDSTIAYAYRKIELAESSGNDELIKDAVLDLADRYAMSGLYDAILSLFEEYEYQWFEEARYLSILNTVYSNLSKSSNDLVLSAKYTRKKDEYQQKLLSTLKDDDIGRIFIQTDILLENDKAQEVLDLLLPWVASNDPALEDQGVIYYTMARAYSMIGDSDNAILWYAKSARSDLLVPKYEYRSLYELASCLYEKHDIERAYTYINRSVQDAVRSNAQLHKQFSYQILPVISSSYDKFVSQKNKAIVSALLVSCFLLFFLVILSVFLIRERNRVLIAERQTKESNQMLQQLTDQLQKNVNILQETNQVKDIYLGRYLNMCSEYIDGLEKYRTSLRKVIKDGEDAMTALKSKEFMEKALNDFYNQFDATFLDLFPDFISQLNELLQEDKKVSYHSKERLLTTELRVLALIRLGVNDSVKIASFLRRSVSTVYNYRVKMRNASVCDREEFENRIMDIGTRQ